MLDNCCVEQKKINDDLLVRSIIFIVFGLLMIIPIIETTLLSFWSGYLFFSASTLLLGISIYSDFPDDIWFCALVVLSIICIMVSPIYLTGFSSILCLSVGISLSLLSIFVKKETFEGMISRQKSNNKIISNMQISNVKIFFEFPATKKLILMFIMICWTTSLASFFPAFNAIYSMVIQESFLIYGSQGISSYIMYTMQSTLLPHNHETKKIIILENSIEKIISLNALKKGMKVRLTEEVLIPVEAIAIDQCEITSNRDEKRVWVERGYKIPKNTYVHSGTIGCCESYQVATHAQQKSQTDNNDHKLNFILLTTFLISLISGIYHSILFSSASIGLKYLTTNLIVACPCVFFTVKSIFNNKLLNWIKYNTNIGFNTMFSLNKPNIMVFDRTHTLYEEDPNNKEGPYKMIKGVYPLLKKLKKSGVVCYILSGHPNEQHREDCVKDLGAFINEENIIFDEKYHDVDKAHKKEVIRNLQLYGTKDKPNNFLKRVKCYLVNLFSRNIVGMVGDGENDIMAMRQADLSFCVLKDNFSSNQSVLETSNFHINQKSLLEMHNLLEAIDQSSKYTNVFMYTGLLINIAMLMIINGLFKSMVFISMSSACIFMPLICISIIAISTQMNLNILKVQNDEDVIQNTGLKKHTSSNQIRPHKCKCCSNSLYCHEITDANEEENNSLMKPHN